MKYCPECLRVYPLDDPFEEDRCPSCEEDLEDVDEYMETPSIFCSACGADGMDVFLPVTDEGEYVCPECGAVDQMCIEPEE